MAEYPTVTEPYPPTPESPSLRVYGGDCLAVLRSLPDASVHAIVTDPPYGLSEVGAAKLTTALTAWVNGDREQVPDGKGFMGRAWDAFVPPPAVWDECLRVLRPGGHLVAFAGSRTYDLMGLSIRLAGFEIRDGLQWIYGSGFPKGQDVGKAIDKAAGAEREIVRTRRGAGLGSANTFAQDEWTAAQRGARELEITAPATDAARTWDGWNTALKPAVEPMVLARKPLSGTVAATVTEHGTGAINIGACRVGDDGGARRGPDDVGVRGPANSVLGAGLDLGNAAPKVPGLGRWPANVLLDEHAAAELDAQSGTLTSGKAAATGHARKASLNGVSDVQVAGRSDPDAGTLYGDSGGASRFFPTFRYQAKAPKSERPKVDGVAHPTVKPLALMRWLVTLLTPPGGTVLDPFAGSGTTLQAARDEGFSVIGIEREADYWPLIEHRTGVAVERVAPVDPEPVVETPPEPEPLHVAPEPVEPEVGAVDTAELDGIVAKVLAVLHDDRLPIPRDDRIRLEENALTAESVAQAVTVRDEVRAALLAARGAA